jgi:hypothetical protein
MTSYKIHSIKDSEKLSFIIEWEDEKSISQKLSIEGHIILSVEKIEIPEENLFCFEGKKPDNSFIEWKISADDIFVAYEMLKKEYKYTITKLYPQTVLDKEKQEKIFQDLLATFQATIKKEKVVVDSSKQTLSKYKKILTEVISLLQKENISGMEATITELKKLEQNNNVTIIKDELRNILKNLSKRREDSVFFEHIRPLMKEMGMFVMPEIIYSFITRFFHLSQSLDPLIHPKEVYVQKHVVHHDTCAIDPEKEYESIQNNAHIHTFLRKKYRSKIADYFHQKTRKYYIYTLFREKKSSIFTKKTVSILQKIITTALIITVFMACLTVLFWLYATVFVTTNILVVFIILLAGSLVIQSEAV